MRAIDLVVTIALAPLALVRWALVVIFLWFGGMKFTSYEANGIAPFIAHSPFMMWLHTLFGIQGASYVIGVIELSTAAALSFGAFNPLFCIGSGDVHDDVPCHPDVLREHAWRR